MNLSSSITKQLTIFSPSEISKAATTFFSTYGSMMLLHLVAADLIPAKLMSYITDMLRNLFAPRSKYVTLVVDEFIGVTRNQVFEAAEVYLRTKISPKSERIKVGKTPRQNHISLEIEKGEEIVDVYEKQIELKWKLMFVEIDRSQDKKFFELNFKKKYKEKIVASYLPYLLAKADMIKREAKQVKLFSRDILSYNNDDAGGLWGSVNLDHPSTFDTLAMDLDLKKTIVDDLERFVRRKDFYKKVGKAWKRGYLLYGPPGTGKSSLIAAMANYLKFDVYDLELTSVYSNGDLKRLFLSTNNRSILVIEDIDCSAETKDRQSGYDHQDSSSELTLSGILNFIDGLWSSCGDERIIVFTTNHKDHLDPALLRPGRMDMHIHLSYCSVNGFKILASNYLGDDAINHRLYGEIEGLIERTEVTPAELAEELMKDENTDIVMQGLVKFLESKEKIKGCPKETCRSDDDDGDDRSKKSKKFRKKRNGGRGRRGLVQGNGQSKV